MSVGGNGFRRQTALTGFRERVHPLPDDFAVLAKVDQGFLYRFHHRSRSDGGSGELVEDATVLLPTISEYFNKCIDAAVLDPHLGNAEEFKAIVADKVNGKHWSLRR